MSSNTALLCRERLRLADDLKAANEHYKAAVQSCSRTSATDSLNEHEQKRIIVEQASRQCEHMREALIEHRREHGC
jgi:hypothetical protein